MATLEELLAEKERRLSGTEDQAQPPGRLQALLAEKDRRQPAEASLADAIRSFLPPGLREEPREEVGVAARAAVEGVAAIPGMVIDPILNLMERGVRALGREPEQVTVGEAASLLSDQLGLPPGEGLPFEVAKGMAGVSPGVFIGRGLAAAGGPVTRRVGEILAETPGIQTAAGTSGAAASELVEQAGGGPGSQLAAGILAGGATPAAFPRAAARTAARTAPARAAATVGEPVTRPTAADRSASMLESLKTEIPPQPVAAAELAGTARRAAEGGFGSARAARVLAEQAAPDQGAVEAARRLGIEEFLQPDHVSTNQAFRELSQVIKSIPGSRARELELKGFEQIGKRADDLIEEIGGTTDLSALDVSVRSRMSAVQEGLEKQAETLYGQLRDEIPAKAEAAADNLLAFLNGKADDLGGVQFLEPLERRLLKQLSPTDEGVLPTYARLDNTRKQLVRARIAKEGVFKDADSGLIKKLESELLKDQQIVAAQFGQAKTFEAARASVAVRKGLESDMAALFGKNLDGTILSSLSTGIAKLSQGDVSKFMKMLNAIPPEIRKEVVASGLGTAFGKNARNGQLNFTSYAKWFEGLQKNKQAMNALMSNLPKEARKGLTDLFKVSNGIRKATRERITTGRLGSAPIKEALQGADSLMGNVYGLARRSAGTAAAEAVATGVGLPGAGLASGITVSLMRNKGDALKAADDLISSPQFIEAASKATPEAAANLAKTSAFKRYREALGNPSELSRPEDWILSAFRATAQSQPEEN